MTRFLIYYHIYHLGHSVETRKLNTKLAEEAAEESGRRGWLFRCSCGVRWSR